MEAAPFASRQAPSPSLPFATLVAAFIAVMGGLFVARTLADLQAPPALLVSGRVDGQRFVSADRRLAMEMPRDWILQAGRPPVLLEAMRRDPALSFSLARARAPLFREGDLVPSGALARFAARQEADLQRSLAGFRLLFRAPIPGEPPGIRLAFAAGDGSRRRVTVQEYLLWRDRILVLTLSGAAELGADRLAGEMDMLSSALRLEDVPG